MAKKKTLMEEDIDMSPLIEGAKNIIGHFFPSQDRLVKQEEKKLEDLKKRVKIKELQAQQKRVLKELEEKEQNQSF